MIDPFEERSREPLDLPPAKSVSNLTFALSIPIFLVLTVYAGWNFRSVTGYWGELAQSGSFPDSSSRRLVRVAPDFDTRKAIIPTAEIRSGGPPKDGIPAISQPKCLPRSQAKYLRPDDRVIGIAIGRESRAYPLRILNYHEIVNDLVAETPVAVTYCPLCDSSVVFDRRTRLGKFEFGVSGLLYNSNVLMYNRSGNPDSLWSQLQTSGVTGPAAGETLKTLPLEVTSWQDWSTRHPETTVLSDQTGYQRDYTSNPYAAYFGTPDLMFPVGHVDKRLPSKTPVLGVWSGTTAKAFVVNGIRQESISDTIGDQRILLEYSKESNSLRVVDAADGVEWMYTFWFAWSAFRPQTEIRLTEQPD